MKLFSTLLLTLLIALPLQGAHAEDTIVGRPGIIDGDTLRFPTTKIRLFGIDAPEKDQTCFDAADVPWACGHDSTVALQKLISGGDVRCTPMDVDRYNRIVAICFVDQTEINAWMVENGWAVAYRKYSTRYVPQEDAARSAKKGVWRGRFTMPWKWRRSH